MICTNFGQTSTRDTKDFPIRVGIGPILCSASTRFVRLSSVRIVCALVSVCVFVFGVPKEPTTHKLNETEKILIFFFHSFCKKYDCTGNEYMLLLVELVRCLHAHTNTHTHRCTGIGWCSANDEKKNWSQQLNFATLGLLKRLSEAEENWQLSDILCKRVIIFIQ